MNLAPAASIAAAPIPLWLSCAVLLLWSVVVQLLVRWGARRDDN